MKSVLYSFVCVIAVASFVYVIVKVFLSMIGYHKRRYPNTSPLDESRQTFMDVPVISWKTRRDMGRYESHLVELDYRLGTKNYAVISLRSRVTLRREQVQNALVLLSRKHPLLRTSVDVHARGLYSFYENIDDSVVRKKQFVVFGDREFWPELRFVNTSHWRIVLEEELSVNKVSSMYKALWRTILLREQYHASDGVYTNTLLFVFDQVIMDRKSVVQFIKSFHNFLCKLANCDIHVADTKTLELQSATEDLLKEPSYWKSLQFMVEDKLNKLFNFGSALSYRRVGRRRALRKLLFLSKRLSTEQTLELFNCCLKMNCSLTSLFTVAWSQLKTGHPVNGNIERTVFNKSMSVVVDFRESLATPLPTLYLGNYSSNVHLRLPSCQETKHFWSSVKYCDYVFTSAVKQEKHLDLIWKLKYCNQIRSITKRPAFEIADVGKFDIVESHPFWLDEIYLGASGTSEVSLTLVVVNNRLSCGMYMSCRGNKMDCTGALNALLDVVQNMCCQ